MSRRRKIGMLLLAVFVLAPLLTLYRFRGGQHDEGRAGGFAVESVSLINLIATPERYDGKWIQVEGVCCFEFEGNALYLSRDDLKHRLTRNAVWASYDRLSADAWDPVFTSKFHRRHVLVEGYFSSQSHGHFGLFSGAITNVTRIMTK